MAHLLSNIVSDRLTRLNGATFQSLCDEYLCYKFYNHIRVFDREGSQRVKDKTIAGTPDTLFILDDDSVIYVETTTVDRGIVEKLKSDIDACFDTKKSVFDNNDIRAIYLCYNSNLDSKQVKEIDVHAGDTLVYHINLDLLTNEICHFQPWLAESYLDVSELSHDMFSISLFVKKYNESAKHFSYPLNNEFKFRENEKKKLYESIASNPITVVRGAPGIGKTRIATEVLQEYSKNENCRVVAIRSLTNDILPKLRMILGEPDTNYILFFDDANVSIKDDTLLTKLLEDNPSSLKVVMTVKDHAYSDLADSLLEYKPKTLELKAFTHSEIEDIISSEPFNIDIFTIKTHISSLVAGNVRLAAMMAKVVSEKGYKQLINSIEELYDVYFKGLYKTKDETELKLLSVLSVFRSLEFGTDNTDEILKTIGIDIEKVLDAINTLDRKDFIDVRHSGDKIIARISDQNIAAYTLRNFVIGQGVISFTSIFRHYFKQWHRLIQEAIYQANYIPHDKNFNDSIHKLLIDYLDNIEDDEELRRTVYKDFWAYIPDEAFQYWNKIIQSVPKVSCESITTSYSLNQFSFHQDEVLISLMLFLASGKEYCELSLELMLDYCHRDVNHLPELAYWLKERTAYEPTDVECQLPMMNNIVDYLALRIIKGDILAKHLFVALAEKYLEQRSQHNRTIGRNFTITTFNLVASDSIVKLRQKVWKNLFYLHHSLTLEVNNCIWHYLNCFQQGNDDVVIADLELLIPFVQENLNADSFSDTLLVQCLIDRSKGYHSIDTANLKSKFDTEDYRFYQLLKYSGREYDYDLNNFIKDKETVFPKSIKIENKNDVIQVVERIQYLLKTVDIQKISFGVSILNEVTAKNDLDLGIFMFKQLLSSVPSFANVFIVSRVLSFLSTTNRYLDLESFIFEYQGEQATALALTYLRILPEESVCSYHKDKLKECIRKVTSDISICPQEYIKFCDVRELLHAIYDVNKALTFNIKLERDFYAEEKLIKNDLELYQQTYLQQLQIDNGFDYYNKFIEQLYRVDSSFVLVLLRDYILTNKVELHRGIPFLFNDGYDEKLLFLLLDVICDSFYDYRTWRRKSLGIIFTDLDERHSGNARKILFDYYKQKINDKQKLSLIFAITRQLYQDLYEQMLLDYVNEKSADDFMDIDWHPSHSTTISGSTTFGDVEKIRWLQLLSVVEKSSNRLKVVAIRSKINKMVRYAEESSESERDRMFLRGELN